MKKQDTFDTGRTTILCSGLILVLILLDQVAKHEALLHLKDHSSISLIPGVLELAYVENRWHGIWHAGRQTVLIWRHVCDILHCTDLGLCQDTEEQILSATAAHRSSIVWRGSRELY